MKRSNLIGQKFGFLTAIELAYVNKLTYWRCVCDCGKEVIVKGYKLKSGEVKSCGCLRKQVCAVNNLKHGMCKTRLYRIWTGMKARCFNVNVTGYKNYGGRGIGICEEWMGYESFYSWAINNGYTGKLTIERIDNNGNYEPSNCKWVTMQEQGINKRNNKKYLLNGEILCISEIARKYNLPEQTLHERIKRGLDIKTATETTIVRKTSVDGTFE